MQARAKALADDEKNLANLVGSCPSYQTIGLPQGPSQFHKYLDEKLLAQHNLLIPSQYFPHQSSAQTGLIGLCMCVDLHVAQLESSFP